MKLIEDFAHHPTAVEKTIQAVRELYLSENNGRLFVLFEPRSATSRRKVFQQQYANAFSNADVIMISKPYDQTKIAEEDRFSSEQLVEDLGRQSLRAELYDSVDAMVKSIHNSTQPGDVVLIMSNGAFDGIYEKLMKA